jgi:hypothetical protein
MATTRKTKTAKTIPAKPRAKAAKATEPRAAAPAKAGTLISAKYRERYKDGSCGDALAAALAAAVTRDKSLDLDALAAVASANGIDLARWSHLNPGGRRMGLGNVLRAKVRRGETVVIRGVAFPSPATE